LNNFEKNIIKMANPGDMMKVQNQIRENSMQIRDYVDELNKWEEDINTKDSKLSAKAVQNNINENTVLKPAIEKPKDDVIVIGDKKLKRDGNTVGDYYKAWDKFDVVTLKICLFSYNRTKFLMN